MTEKYIKIFKHNKENKGVYISFSDEPENPFYSTTYLGNLLDFEDNLVGTFTSVSLKDFKTIGDLYNEVRKRFNAKIILPLYRFYPKGITYSLSKTPKIEENDYERVGLVYVTEEDFDILDNTVEEVIEILEEELKDYEAFCNGKVVKGELIEWDEKGSEVTDCVDSIYIKKGYIDKIFKDLNEDIREYTEINYHTHKKT